MNDSKMISISLHPKYKKYFQMLKNGISFEAIQQKMKVDGIDPNLLLKDSSEMIPIEVTSSITYNTTEMNKKLEKYSKMLIAGLPMNAITTTMRIDGIETKDCIELCKHSQFAKYFQMIRCGISKEAVKIKMDIDGFDSMILERNPHSFISSKVIKPKKNINYFKYQKMIKVGIPVSAIESEMIRDNANISFLHEILDFIELKDHFQMSKYFKMLHNDIAIDAIKMQMVIDGFDPGLIENDPNVMVIVNENMKRVNVPFHKFRKMIKSGIPQDVVEGEMLRLIS